LELQHWRKQNEKRVSSLYTSGLHLPLIITLVVTAILLVLLFTKNPNTKWIVGTTLIISQVLATIHNVRINPHQVLWLCNITATLGIILLFTFRQRLFDIFIFFAWTGDVFTLLIPDSVTLPPVDTYPIFWISYWLKHISPLTLTLYFFYHERRSISYRAITFVIGIMFAYTAVMYVWDVIFDQNIMDLRWPTVEIERSFGPWPVYIFVDMLIAMMWYGVIYTLAGRLGVIAEAQRKIR